ncbi:MAG: sulfatase-like hydrolase/transferase [candidate division KSB1 bacterium]|nr:sulfatase-like hydrolase/transferase [candidate division KSB1 bacterium]
MDALENSRYAKDTLLIVTSDHGYHMGEKEYIFKNTLWEESSRIPLIIHLPGTTKSAEICQHPVSLIDLYPTMNDICSLPNDPNAPGNGQPLDGYSLRPFLSGTHTDEWEGPEVALTAISSDIPREFYQPADIDNQHYSIRSERLALIFCATMVRRNCTIMNTIHTKWKNLANDPEYASTIKAMKEKLIAMVGLNL